MSAKPETSVYRCADCGHGEHLTAWGAATVHGPLAADGEIAEDIWTEVYEVYEVHEGSIQCSKHPDAVIERCIDGEWCRWWCCPWCLGDAGRCDYVTGTHDGWRPIAEIATMPPLPGIARGHALILEPGEPARLARCRICEAERGSLRGEGQCPGDHHNCPSTVQEGTPDSHRVGGSEDWHCYQPGQMNADFTAWTCRSGHVITRDNHAHPGGRCIIPQSCPWDDLMPAPLASARTAS